MDKIVCTALLFTLLIFSASTASRFGDIKTNTTSWHIERQSGTVGFDLAGSVGGEISPIYGPGGRS